MAVVQKWFVPSVGEDMKHLEISYAASKNVKWYKQSAKQFDRFLKN